MATRISNMTAKYWQGGANDREIALGMEATFPTPERETPVADRQIKAMEQAAFGSRGVTEPDSWIDELQWLAGFPASWGERRSGWFGGV
jgi:hypothetical protein